MYTKVASSFPDPRSAFHWLQYGKREATENWVEGLGTRLHERDTASNQKLEASTSRHLSLLLFCCHGDFLIGEEGS